MCYNLIVGFDIFGVHVAYYGVIIATGLLIGIVLCDFLCRKRGYDNNIPYVLVLLLVPLAIFGARLYYIVFSDQLTMADFFDELRIIATSGNSFVTISQKAGHFGTAQWRGTFGKKFK